MTTEKENVWFLVEKDLVDSLDDIPEEEKKVTKEAHKLFIELEDFFQNQGSVDPEYLAFVVLEIMTDSASSLEAIKYAKEIGEDLVLK